MTRFRSNGAYPPTCEHCRRPKDSHGGLYGMGACPPYVPLELAFAPEGGVKP